MHLYDLWGARLPNHNPLLHGAIHLAIGNAESLVPLGNVGQSAIHSPFAQRVGVNFGQSYNLLLANVLCPQSGVGDVEPLGCGVAVNLLGLHSAECVLQSGVGYPQTTLVGNVLTECEATVGIYGTILTVQYNNFVELGNQFVGELIETLLVFFLPPVVEVTILVVLTTLVYQIIC